MSISPRTMIPIFARRLAISFLLLAATPVRAELVDRVEGWDIEAGSVAKPGCSMSMSFANGVTLAFFRTPVDPDQVAVLAISSAWTLTAGQRYPVQVTIGRESRELSAMAHDVTTGKGLSLVIPAKDFYSLFGRSTAVFRISYSGSQLIGYAPRGVDINAAHAVGQCLKRFDNPFAGR